jgi:hypothetical protein
MALFLKLLSISLKKEKAFKHFDETRSYFNAGC